MECLVQLVPIELIDKPIGTRRWGMDDWEQRDIVSHVCARKTKTCYHVYASNSTSRGHLDRNQIYYDSRTQGGPAVGSDCSFRFERGHNR